MRTISLRPRFSRRSTSLPWRVSRPIRIWLGTARRRSRIPDLRWGRCDLKTLNLLPNVLASQAAKERGTFEAMLIRDGVVTEGTKTNFFGVVDGTLRTHPCDDHILPGITRSILSELARELKVDLDETPIRASEIPWLSELFLSGTTTDVMPVVTLDNKPVGNGKPGEVTRKLQRVLAESLASGGD